MHLPRQEPSRVVRRGSGRQAAPPAQGNASASPVFASALWSLDWALRAASSGVQGLNFHGHLGVCGSRNQSPICAPNAEAADVGDVTAQPEYYGLLAAQPARGWPVCADQPDRPRSVAEPYDLGHARSERDGEDRDRQPRHVGLGQPVSIPMSGYTATEEPFASPSVEARSGIALGGAPVTGIGEWQPKPAMLSRSGRCFVSSCVRPAP